MVLAKAIEFDVLDDDLGTAGLELVALAAHGLDEHRELQLTTAGDLDHVGRVGVLEADRLVAELLALEPVADSPVRLAALLIGVGAGPLITPWASLATLLWNERLRAVGIDVPWRRYVLWGLLAAPVVVALAVIPLAWR